MAHITLVLPFALPAPEFAPDLTRALQAPALAALLSKTSGRHYRPLDAEARVLPHELWIAEALGLARGLVPGVAASAMRGVGLDTTVLVMSAMSGVDQRIEGLRAGGDDYLVKPFSLEEMCARIDVLIRRRPRGTRVETVLRAGELALDLVRRRATLGARELALLPTESRVLEFMMRNAGRVLTRTMIFEAVWGCRFDPGTNLIDVHIGRLRKKVNRPGAAPLIRTIRGSGYMLG